MDFDIDVAIQGAVASLGEIANKNASRIAGFSLEQLRLLAEETAAISDALAVGSIERDSEDHRFFEERLAQKVKNFAAAVMTLIAVGLEQAYNAVINALWKALNGALATTGVGSLLPPGMPH